MLRRIITKEERESEAIANNQIVSNDSDTESLQSFQSSNYGGDENDTYEYNYAFGNEQEWDDADKRLDRLFHKFKLLNKSL